MADPATCAPQDSIKVQDELRSDAVRLLRELEIAREAADASGEVDGKPALRAAAEAEEAAAAAQTATLQQVRSDVFCTTALCTTAAATGCLHTCMRVPHFECCTCPASARCTLH
jgi:hypothetical protein